MDDLEKQERIYQLMERSYPDTAEKIQLSRAVREGNLACVATSAEGFQQDSYLDDLLCYYESQKKSVATAQTLNAILQEPAIYIFAKENPQ